MKAFVYILCRADGSYDIGSARGELLDRRLGEHQAGTYPGYTSRRRPVTLVWAEQFLRFDEAVAYERRLKGWSRAKKEALIRGDWEDLQRHAKRAAAKRRSDASPSF
ncbi:GIY-YIG nuclease family protein [uncultured Methylobacterium sp.]|uniref:GIY-YIG nuclease family protein n=1 Tax=uncultured Methylobacterium sp. TaxID=157278 RepID=UPI0035CA23BD